MKHLADVGAALAAARDRVAAVVHIAHRAGACLDCAGDLRFIQYVANTNDHCVYLAFSLPSDASKDSPSESARPS